MARVPKSEATYKSGPKKGKLKPGCRFVRGGQAVCTDRSKKPSPRKRGVGATRRASIGTGLQARSWFDGYVSTLDSPNESRASIPAVTAAAQGAAMIYYPKSAADRKAFVKEAIAEARRARFRETLPY